MSLEVEEVAKWAISKGLTTGNADTLSGLLDELGKQIDELREKRESADIQAKAAQVQLASIHKLAVARWAQSKPCPLCQQLGHHSEVCYARSSTGYDLLAEHEATIRENDELRAALAAKMPVNGKHILSGEKYVSLRQRVQGRFSRHEG